MTTYPTALFSLVILVLLFSCGGKDRNNSDVDGGLRDAAIGDSGVDLANVDKEGETLDNWSNGECRLDPVPDPFKNPNTELHWDATGLPFPDFTHAIMSPVVVDFVPESEGDLIPEIVVVSYKDYQGTGVLRVISGRSPYTTLLTFTGDGSAPIAAPNTETGGAVPALRFDAHPAAGDLNGDGNPEIVAIKQDGGLVAFTYDANTGTFKELWNVGQNDWPSVNNAVAETYHTNANGSVAIANIDMIGAPEIIVGRLVVNGADGSERWLGTGSKGVNGQGPLSCVANLDETGPMEVIAGNTVYSSTGSIVWQGQGHNNGFCAIADVISNDDGSAGKDGFPELISVDSSKVYFHETRLNGNEGVSRWTVHIPQCDESGNLTCTSNCTTNNKGGAPTVADFDGDGQAEVGVAGGSCYVVFDPECKGGGVAGCKGDGIRWVYPTEDDSSNVTSSTVFDFNGDGSAEVIYNDEQRFLVLDGKTGEEVFSDWNASRTRTEQPVVADVDNDGNAEIVFVSSTEAGFAGDQIPGDVAAEQRIPGVEIWSSNDDSWVRARRIWNQHTYHISNVDEEGVIYSEEPPSWKSHNTYRLNVAVGDSLSAPDLGADVGSSYCDGVETRLCVQLFNAGDVVIGPGIQIIYYRNEAGGEQLATAETVRNINPGTYGEVVCGNWRAEKAEHVDVVAVIDAASTERECVEDNNSILFQVQACGPNDVF